MLECDFDGETFVAFIDISGFKEMMKDEKRLYSVLNAFYSYAYNIVSINTDGIKGLFISDCGILYNIYANKDKINGLTSLLEVIKKLNTNMCRHDVMLTTSIAYGGFAFKGRLETLDIRKEFLYGDAYLKAYLDNSIVKPRIQPGQCRILEANLPLDIKCILKDCTSGQVQTPLLLSLINKRDGDAKHYYFYWMCNDKSKIKIFETNYMDSYKRKYGGMLEALKEESNPRDVYDKIIEVDSSERLRASVPRFEQGEWTWQFYEEKSGAIWCYAHGTELGGPQFTLKPHEAILPDGSTVNLRAHGFSWTGEELRLGKEAWQRQFGVQPPQMSGPIAWDNLANFQYEYATVRNANPELNLQAVAVEAVKHISFGKARIKAGYGDFKVEMKDLANIVVKRKGRDGQLIEEELYNVPTEVYIEARPTSSETKNKNHLI